MSSQTAGQAKGKRRKGKERERGPGTPPRSVIPPRAPHDNRLVTILVGPTGAGKSEFARIASDNDTFRVGHSLHSETKQVQPVDFEMEGKTVCLVDTPGFGDTHCPDHVTLNVIADWLRQNYQDGVYLSGILFFHRISDNRLSKHILDTLYLFIDMCGKDAFKYVTIVTTMGQDVPDQSLLASYRRELDEAWKPLLERGARVQDFTRTKASAHEILSCADDSRFFMQIQKELGEGKEVYSTTAGLRVFGRFFVWLAELLKRLREHFFDDAVMVSLPEDIPDDHSAHSTSPSRPSMSSSSGTSTSYTTSGSISDATSYTIAATTPDPARQSTLAEVLKGLIDQRLAKQHWDPPPAEGTIPEAYKEAIASAISVLRVVQTQCNDSKLLTGAFEVATLALDLYRETTGEDDVDPSATSTKIGEFVQIIKKLLEHIESYTPRDRLVRPFPFPTEGGTSTASMENPELAGLSASPARTSFASNSSNSWESQQSYLSHATSRFLEEMRALMLKALEDTKVELERIVNRRTQVDIDSLVLAFTGTLTLQDNPGAVVASPTADYTPLQTGPSSGSSLSRRISRKMHGLGRGRRSTR